MFGMLDSGMDVRTEDGNGNRRERVGSGCEMDMSNLWPSCITAFVRAFERLEPTTAFPYERIYAPEVLFEDPFRRVEGLSALREHFEAMNTNLVCAEFRFDVPLLAEGEAALAWVMHLTLRRGPRRPVVVPGMSHLRFGERVHVHRDYFDAGALVYEQLPVLGSVIRCVKRVL